MVSSTQDIAPQEKRPGWMLLAAATFAVVISMAFGYFNELAKTGNVSAGIGSAVGQFAMAVVIALLFSISSRYRNSRSRTIVVFVASCVLTLASFYRGTHRLSHIAEKAAKEINAGAPRMADSGTRIDGASAGPGQVLTIRATLVRIDGRDVDHQYWRVSMTPKIRTNALGNAALKKLLSFGVTIVYRFSGRDGAFIDELTLTPQDANEAPK